MGGNMNVTSDYFTKLTNNKKTKQSHANTLDQKFNYMEEYANNVKSYLTDSNDTICNDQSSKMVGWLKMELDRATYGGVAVAIAIKNGIRS